MLPLALTLSAHMAFAGAKVSAYAPDNKMGKNYWNGAAALDGKMSTAWMVPAESPNRGEWIELDLPKGEVSGLKIMPGFGKDDDTFHDYARVKQVRVDIFTLDDEQNAKQVATATVDVADKMEEQILPLPKTKVGQEGLFGGKVRISVVDIYPGQDYPNLAISELSMVLTEFDAPSAKATQDGTAVDALNDANAKTTTVVKDGAEFGIERGGYSVASMGFFVSGKDSARPKTVEVTVGTQDVKTVLPDVWDGQWVELPDYNGFNGGDDFDDYTVKIIDSYPGAKSTDITLTDVKFKATTLQSL